MSFEKPSPCDTARYSAARGHSQGLDSILDHRPDSREELRDDEPLRSHLRLKLQIVGEAAANLDSEVREAAPGIPWREIVGMRNVLVHDYESVDLDILWDVVEDELPSLRSDIEDLLNRLESGEPEP